MQQVFRDLFRIALPLMLGSFLQMVYNLTDSYFLGKLGKEELSAPAIVMTLIFFLVTFGMGLAEAGSTLIAQSKGKNDQQRVDFYLGQSTLALVLVSLVIMVFGLVIAKPLLHLLRTPQEILYFALDYMIIIFWGIPLMFGFFVAQSALRGVGNTKTPFKIQLVTVTLNVILDPILIYGWLGVPALGVRGAAIATVTARGLASVLAFAVLIRGKHGVHLKASNLKPDTAAILLMLRVGVPAALGRSIAMLGFVVLQGIVNTFGTAVIAAFGVGNRIINLFNVPCMSISMGTAAMIGQSLGAKDYERAHQVIVVSIKSVLGFIVPSMTLMFFWGNLVTRFFVNDPDTIYHGAMLFRIVSVSVIFFGLFNVVAGTSQGAGDTKPLMVLQILRLWGFRVPVAYLLALTFGFGPPGIWVGMFISNIACFVLGLLWLRRGSWKTAIDVDVI